MPWKVRKRGSKYVIVKLLPGGREKTVGHSRTRKRAEASVRARYRAAKGK